MTNPKRKNKAPIRKTHEEIVQIIRKLNREGPDALTPDEIDAVLPYEWDEEVDGMLDPDVMLQDMLSDLDKNDKDMNFSKLSGKEKTEYANLMIKLHLLIDNLNKFMTGQVGEYCPAEIARHSTVSRERIEQVLTSAKKKFHKLPKKDREFLRDELDGLSKRHIVNSGGGATKTSYSVNKDNYSESSSADIVPKKND